MLRSIIKVSIISFLVAAQPILSKEGGITCYKATELYLCTKNPCVEALINEMQGTLTFKERQHICVSNGYKKAPLNRRELQLVTNPSIIQEFNKIVGD